MARDLSSGVISHITAESLFPFIAVEIEFEDGYTRAWSGYGSIQIAGNEFLGVGTLGSIGSIAESTQNQATGLQIQLSGVPFELIASALNEKYQGNSCNIYFGVLTQEHIVVADPYKIFSGRIDTMQVQEQQESATISLSVESRMIDLEKPRVRRYTPQDQSLDFTGDKGFDYVTSLQEAVISWGA